eukprot:2802859-Pyramimonas_sp.AAC.1
MARVGVQVRTLAEVREGAAHALSICRLLVEQLLLSAHLLPLLLPSAHLALRSIVYTRIHDPDTRIHLPGTLIHLPG